MGSLERVERQTGGERRHHHAAGKAIDPPDDPATARLCYGGVPIFPNTPEGQAERLAYYDARKLNHLPNSLLDYHDVIRGRETPAERRAREGRTTGRRR